MGVIVTPGIVLRYVNYQDHDRMLTLFTPEYGCLSVLSRGCRRPKSPLLAGSEWLAYGEYTLFRGRENCTASACSLEDQFYPLRLEPYRLCCAGYMAALCREAARPDCEARSLFSLLLKGLYYLSYDTRADALATTTAFVLLLMDLAGYRPRLVHCVHCGTLLHLEGDSFLDITAGGLCCPDCTSKSTIRLSHDQVVWISRTLREGKLEQPHPVENMLFCALRDYARGRLDVPAKAGSMLP